ncbi:hypothetical protein D3C80_2148170 [compost metagenome]
MKKVTMPLKNFLMPSKSPATSKLIGATAWDGITTAGGWATGAAISDPPARTAVVGRAGV